jgi:hypothetical protein
MKEWNAGVWLFLLFIGWILYSVFFDTETPEEMGKKHQSCLNSTALIVNEWISEYNQPYPEARRKNLYQKCMKMR